MYCSCKGEIAFGRKVFDEMTKNYSVPWSAMIGGYVRLGRSNNAVDLFRQMQIRGVCPDEITMVSVLCACTDLAIHGRGLQAASLFQEMIRDGVTPDGVVFIGLLSACSHSGCVEKGKEYFDLMRKEFGILPKTKHYGCMVDMLCRAGLVREAAELVQEMPIEPNCYLANTDKCLPCTW
ncbi:AFG1-like ATPase family protein [Hibiscus syriacus]|uniref:AFG1-like ATPase family protein n=1 Tax=Hibiscus syriacus TaxID=106335 RepID=A0A6A2X3U8_HIBSY|nr:AFG1-like ATPase family protein [Hibiscus syriacus]